MVSDELFLTFIIGAPAGVLVGIGILYTADTIHHKIKSWLYDRREHKKYLEYQEKRRKWKEAHPDVDTFKWDVQASGQINIPPWS